MLLAIQLTHSKKELLFEAISRLGWHDAAAIASRVETKSEFEVAQYLALLDSSTAKRKHDRQDLDPIAPAELPAAMEVSPACCNALEDAADSLSLRQETYEAFINTLSDKASQFLTLNICTDFSLLEGRTSSSACSSSIRA